MTAVGGPLGATFQTRAVPSWPPVASSVLSRLKSRASTRGPLAISADPATCWVAVSHSWTFPSVLAEATRVPSGLNVTASTGLGSELIGDPISAPVAALHSRTVPSAPPVTTVEPSGLNATASPCAGLGWAGLGSVWVLIPPAAARFHWPTVLASAASSTFPPSAKIKVRGAAPRVVTRVVWCVATSHSRIVPLAYPAASVRPSSA